METTKAAQEMIRVYRLAYMDGKKAQNSGVSLSDARHAYIMKFAVNSRDLRALAFEDGFSGREPLY